MQVQAFDDEEEKVDCSKEKTEYDQRVCAAWEAHKAKVAEHKKKYESIGQKHGLMQVQAFDDDEEEVDCDKEKDPYDKRVCKAWKAHKDKVAAHKKKYGGLAQVYDDDEDKVDCSKEKSDYDKRVCQAWEAHKDKVAAHKKKFGGIAQKQGLMQAYSFDDEEEKVDCSKEKTEYDQRVCAAWEAHKAKVAEHKKKYESIGQKHGLMQVRAFDDDEDKVDCSKEKSDYDKRVCQAWEAHKDKVAAHKKKFGGIAQKQGLAQVYDDDEDKVDCSKEKSDYDKRVCQAWEAHKAKVAEHKKKYESIGQKHGLMQQFAFEDDDEEEKKDCSNKKTEYEQKECEAWKAHHEKVAAHKKKYESLGKKQAHALMQAQAYDDEPRDCSGVKDDYEQRVCQKWRAHDVRVIDHHTKFPSLYQLLDDPEGVACDDFKEEFEKKECLAWKAYKQKVKDHKEKYGEPHRLAQMRMLY